MCYLAKGVNTLSKKKRRFLKNKKKAEGHISAPPKDTHHLCYQRKNWHGGYVTELRDFWYCRLDIPKNTLHRAIHKRVDSVPAPKATNAKSALEQLHKLEVYGAIHEDDTIEMRLELLAALFDCVEQPTADAFRRQLQVVHEYQKAP